MAAEDLTAKDLLRSGELPVVDVCGWQLSSRLMRRKQRRPAGSSPRLWAKVGMEDPFATQKSKAELELVEHRAPAAAQRFKQIDKHAKKKERNKLPAQKPQHSRQLQARLAADEKAARAKEKRKRLAARYGEAAADALLGLDSASPNAPAPKPVKRKRPLHTPSAARQPGAETSEDGENDPVDRRPPRFDDPEVARRGKKRLRVTSRRDEDGVDRRPPRVGLAAEKGDPAAPRRTPSAADGVDRRPPRVGRSAESSERRGRRRPTVSTGADAIDRRPPRVGLAAEQDAAAEAIDRTPPRVGPAAELDRTPPKPGEGGAATGMDDLFGGMQQGRVRRSKKEKTSRNRVLVTENPDGAVDRTPPRLDRPPPAEAAAEPAVDRTPPKIDRTPPKPGDGGAATGMDDLFGGMQQGRVRRPKNETSGRKKVLVTENPEGTVDRTPPRLDRPPPPEPEPDTVPSVDRTPPKIDRTPPRRSEGGASSGMDDLLGGMPQGRVRRPKEEKTGRKRVLVTENPDGAVDRTPPRLGRPSPSEAAPDEPTPAVDRSPPKIDRTPPKPGGGGASSGMDDLFGGIQQGRVRRPKEEKTGRKKVLVTENPGGGVDRTPPRLDRPPEPKAAEPAPELAAPQVDRRPPRIDRTPPKPGGGGASSGMDDLFGGMQEGRLRRPKPDEAQPKKKKVVVTENPDGAVDRTPPRIVDKD